MAHVLPLFVRFGIKGGYYICKATEKPREIKHIFFKLKNKKMKHTKIIIAAAITVALGTGIIISCAKDNPKINVDQTVINESKNRDNLSLYNDLLNECYNYCITAFLNDSATFMDSCSLETLEAFCHVTGISTNLLDEMGTLAESIWPEIPEAEDNDPEPDPGAPDYCPECEGISYIELGLNMIAIYHIVEEISELDPTFDIDSPLKALPNDPCRNNCSEHEPHTTEWDTCFLFCFSNLNKLNLLAYLELLHDLLHL